MCVDSYENGVPQGQIFLPGQPGERFESLSQLLLRGELLWVEGNARQSFRSVLELITLMDSALRAEEK